MDLFSNSDKKTVVAAFIATTTVSIATIRTNKIDKFRYTREVLE